MIRRALVIGINRYPFWSQKEGKRLATPARDAEKIASLLDEAPRELSWDVWRMPESFTREGKPQVEEKQITVSQAELSYVIHELLYGEPVPEVALLFFAGHGIRRAGGGFLAASDTRVDAQTEDREGISFSWLRDELLYSPVKKQIVWLDCCHSGDLLSFTEAELEEWHLRGDRSLIAACQGDRVAYAASAGGVLTQELVKALNPQLYLEEDEINTGTVTDLIEKRRKKEPLLKRQIPMCKNFGERIRLWEGKGKNTPQFLSNSDLSWFCSLAGDKNIDESIRKAYQESLPPDASLWLWNLERNNITQMLQELEGFRRLFEFFTRLSKDEKLPEENRNQLSNLAERLDTKKYPVTTNSSDIGLPELESYLIATIENNEKSKDFLINAWLIIDNSIVVNNPSAFEPLIDGNETTQGVECEFNQIAEQLNKFLKKALGYLRGKKYYLTIEIFLPDHLMSTPIDRWKIIDPIDDETTFGVKYPIRLRSLERLNSNYLDLYLSDWYKQWDRIKNILHEKPIPELFEHIEEMETFNWKLLRNNLSEKIGLKLTCAPPQAKRKDLFKAILTATTPIAIWTRCDLPNFDQVAAINEVLNSKDLCHLCESVKNFREKADAQTDDHLGFYLAILWEDPYRLTPNAMLELKTPGQ